MEPVHIVVAVVHFDLWCVTVLNPLGWKKKQITPWSADLKIAQDVKWERKRQCGKSQRALATARGDAVSSDGSIFVSNGHQISEHVFFFKDRLLVIRCFIHYFFVFRSLLDVSSVLFPSFFVYFFKCTFSHRSGSLITPYFVKRFLMLLLATRPKPLCLCALHMHGLGACGWTFGDRWCSVPAERGEYL